MNASETTLGRLIQERETVQRMHEDKLAEVERRDDKTITDDESASINMWRTRAETLDKEIGELAETVDRDRKAIEVSRRIRTALSGNTGAVEENGGVVYRTMAEYARDVILTGTGREASKIKGVLGDKQELERAQQRLELLKRTPESTLSSDVDGLIPEQHIAQIFQVIDSTRPLVSSAQRTTLVRGVISYPQIDARPEVALQGTEKTEAGDRKMEISMQTATADTYLGGGDLSWQAINWSTPNALDMWFRLAGSEYALLTEQVAAEVVTDSAVTHPISSPLGSTPSFADFMTAVGKGGGVVYAASGRMANTVYLAPDRWWYLFGLTSDAQSMFTTVNVSGVGPLNFVASRGLETGEIVVGDSQGLLVAETAGAPVELRVVEPAIGGVEVGVIGAFKAVVVDNGAFSLITTAS